MPGWRRVIAPGHGHSVVWQIRRGVIRGSFRLNGSGRSQPRLLKFFPTPKAEHFLARAKAGEVQAAVFAAKTFCAQCDLPLRLPPGLEGVARPLVEVHAFTLRAFGEAEMGQTQRIDDEAGTTVVAPRRHQKQPAAHPFPKITRTGWPQEPAATMRAFHRSVSLALAASDPCG